MNSAKNGARTFLSAKWSQRRGDIPVPLEAKAWKTERGHSCPRHQRAKNGGWKTPAPVIEAEARETDKALKEILEKLGV